MTAAEQVVDLPFAVAPAMPHIREYREEDAEAVARMWRGSAPAWPGGGPGGGEHSTAARVRQEQRDLNTLATYVAWAPDPEGGQGNGLPPQEVAVGYLSLFEQPSDASAAYVGTLSAHPDWHGKGVGRDLLKAALERTVALGYTRLDLNTWAGNLKAVPLYKKSGYFWVPETSVRMENYLPLIFRLPPAQELFRQADWYRDFRRDLALRPDEEKQGKQEVYTYEWAHEGRRLRVTIDRAAQGVLALETDGFAVSTTIDDPRLPVGGRREVRWRVENRSSQPLPVSILAEGEDSVRAALQVSEEVTGEREWSTAVAAEQPPLNPPVGRPTNRVRSTVVVGGQAIPLALGTEVVQPVRVTFDVAGAGWLSPGVSRRLWVSAENSLDEAVTGTLRLAAPAALTLDRSALDVTLEPRRRASWPVEVTPSTPGLHAIRAQAVVRPQPAPGGSPSGAGEGSPELRTRVFEQVLPCGGPGAVFVEQSESALWIGTDRHSVQLPLRPSRDWAVSFGVVDRATEERILSHSVSIGPPFVPSVLATCTWTAHVEREAGSVTATLSTSPPTLPGLTFERVVRVSGSGLIQLVYRVLNAGPGERPITVDAGTSVRLGMVSGTQVAAPLATGLVVQDAADFPDWEEPDLARPERYAESWMAEFGGGWVGATLWQGAKEVFAGWRSPSLTFDLGTVPPGGQAETPSLYLYAGTGDWKSVRALWRRLIDPRAPAQDPLPRPAYDLRLERFVFDAPSDEVESRLLLESELARGMTGRASVEVNGEEVAGDRVEGLRAGAPQSLPVRLALPQRAGALPAALVFDHEREEERHQAALIRAGRAGTEVRQSQQGEGRETRVTLENGRLRLTAQPGVVARLLELSVPTGSGEWVNQLHAADPAPGTFVWYNPWYGGVHPVLSTGGGWGNTNRLQDETFTWEPAEVEGAQGVRWRGISASTLATSRHLAGLHLTVSYLLVGDGNVVAVRQRVENRSGARVKGSLSMTTFLQPGGDRTKAILAYEDGGRVRRFKRVHGGGWGSPSGWCAVAAPGGAPGGAPPGPALTLVQATPGGTLSSRDMGLEGAHPEASISLDLDPGASREMVAYLIVATDLEEAQRYGALRWAGLA